jgi:hypothetical protein
VYGSQMPSLSEGVVDADTEPSLAGSEGRVFSELLSSEDILPHSRQKVHHVCLCMHVLTPHLGLSVTMLSTNAFTHLFRSNSKTTLSMVTFVMSSSGHVSGKESVS